MLGRRPAYVVPSRFCQLNEPRAWQGDLDNMESTLPSKKPSELPCANLDQRVIVWRMRGEIQQPATYPQAAASMPALCKTASFTLPATADL